MSHDRNTNTLIAFLFIGCNSFSRHFHPFSEMAGAKTEVVSGCNQYQNYVISLRTIP